MQFRLSNSQRYLVVGLVWLELPLTIRHRRRSGWTSGGTHGERRRWVRAKWVGYGEECPLSGRLRGLGERRELPQWGPGQNPAENGFWRILKATERSFLYLYDKIWGRGTFCISVPAPNSGGLVTLFPRDLRPCH